ncbi:hypothetical protein HF521_020115 [Silurus meridionalis]|uniref:Uncharacterized protein n=1 Tax=Silurus meridionalis TaxID=175797 RepID=A0A8T0BI43_SILME|nr:hypothetical protein HF521_020115 [Silurus meridionalis]
MGNVGTFITVHNKTDYTLTICLESGGYCIICHKITVKPREDITENYSTRSAWASFKVKLGDCTEQEWCKKTDLWCEFNPRDNPEFTIKESNDREYIELDCNKNHEMKKPTCPKEGKK